MMKPLFVLLVSIAWTLTGAQDYYQGLMDHLENRLLAIEVRNNLTLILPFTKRLSLSGTAETETTLDNFFFSFEFNGLPHAN